HRVDRRLDATVPPRLRRRDGKVTRHVLVEDVGSGRSIGPVDLDLHVEAAGPQDGRIEEIGPVRGANDDDVAQPFYTIDLGEELPSTSVRNCGTIVASMSDEMPLPRVRKSASISSKKITTGTSSAAFSFAFWNTSRSFRAVSPTYLLSSSGPLTFKKYPLIVSPRRFESFFARLLARALAIMVLPHRRRP